MSLSTSLEKKSLLQQHGQHIHETSPDLLIKVVREALGNGMGGGTEHH